MHVGSCAGLGNPSSAHGHSPQRPQRTQCSDGSDGIGIAVTWASQAAGQTYFTQGSALLTALALLLLLNCHTWYVMLLCMHGPAWCPCALTIHKDRVPKRHHECVKDRPRVSEVLQA